MYPCNGYLCICSPLHIEPRLFVMPSTKASYLQERYISASRKLPTCVQSGRRSGLGARHLLRLRAQGQLLQVSDAQRLRLVEGVSTIPQCRWANVRLSRMLPCNVCRLIYLCRTVRYATKTEERLFAAASVRRSTTSPARRSRAVNSDSDAGSDLPSTRTLLRSCSCCI